MKKLRNFFALLMGFAATSASAAGTWITCDNAPERGWKTYYCFMGTYDAEKKVFTEVEFGTCEGSDEAGEMEPVETEELAIVKINPKLKATSKEWKDALAFDFSNPTFGQSVVYIQPAELDKLVKPSGKESVPVRLKVAKGISGKPEDLSKKVFCR